MATWETDLVLMLRVLINDLNTPQSNTDAYLQRVLVAAGIIVQNEATLSYSYVFDIDAVTISPDPVDNSDVAVQALFPLKAACIINQGSYQTALGQGIRVRDGDSMVDTSVSFRGYKDILELGPCASYEKLRWQLEASSAAGAGAAGFVVSPYRDPDVDAYYNSVTWFFDELASTVQHNCRNRRY